MASIHKRTYRWVDKTGQARTGERYEASYKDRMGKRHRKLFGLKREAQRWLDEQAAGMVTGLWVDPRSGKETVKGYAERWLTRQVVAPATMETYSILVRKHLVPELGGMRMDAVTREDIQKLVRKWDRDGAAATTVKGRYTTLSIIMRAAVKDRVIAITPCEDIALPRVEPKSALVPITTDVVVAIAEAIEETYKAFVIVAAGTGARRGELLGLTTDRVSRAFGRIRIDRQLSRATRGLDVQWGPTKTPASVRNIDVAEFVFVELERHLQAHPAHRSGLVFTTPAGGPVASSTLQAAWAKAAKEVGTTATPHDLRHYYASMQIAGGCSIKKLQALLGHKSATETWDTYGHLVGDEDDRARSVIAGTLGAALAEHAATVPQELAELGSGPGQSLFGGRAGL